MPDFNYEIEDIKLAQQGLERINWVRERMPVLRQIKDRTLAEPDLLQACVLVSVCTWKRRPVSGWTH